MFVVKALSNDVNLIIDLKQRSLFNSLENYHAANIVRSSNPDGVLNLFQSCKKCIRDLINSTYFYKFFIHCCFRFRPSAWSDTSYRALRTSTEFYHLTAAAQKSWYDIYYKHKSLILSQWEK